MKGDYTALVRKKAKSDEWCTPRDAVEIIADYIPKEKTVWMPFDTEASEYVKVFTERGNKIVRSRIGGQRLL